MSQRIEKKTLTKHEINEIKNECFVTGAHNPYGPVETLRAYGETHNALYVPFAYAKKRFGASPNKNNNFPKAEYDFHKKKYPFRTDGGRDQERVFDEAAEKIKKFRSVLLSLYCGFGKCLAKDTPVLMYDGSVKMVQDVAVGDLLMGDDSTPRTVLTLARGREEMYQVVPTKGEPYTVNKSHILSLKISGNNSISEYNEVGVLKGWVAKWFDHTKLEMCTKIFYNSDYNDDAEYTYYSTEEFLEQQDSADIIDISVKDYLKMSDNKCLLGYKVGVEFSEIPVPLDPYMLGYWLSSAKTVDDNDFLNGLVNNKHIPFEFKANSRRIRRQLLAGLLDGYGSFNFTQESERLALDAVYVARSLGLAAFCTNTVDGLYSVDISGDTYMIPTKSKLISSQARNNEESLLTSIRLVPKGIDDYFGFSIDGNHRFLLGDFTVTHNTYTGIRLAQSTGLKTAVLAHRGILFDQWVESIEKFTTARVQRVGTDGILDPAADFYIFNIGFVHKRWDRKEQCWMLRKLGAYPEIGVLIVDEAHIACASEMSKALLYFNPRCCIALTATPKRKDGMDKALELYFGEYETTQIVRIAQDPFTVYRLPTKIKPHFTYNIFGKKDWNSLIKSVIEHEERNQIIIDLVRKFSENNIMILTKRKDHCKILSEHLNNLGITNTIMVGTQKKYDKTARVLLSTYSKLGVGFDDTRLNMLIVACSVTEIEQYAGRLRDGVGKKRIIIDLVDDDANCLSHWQERRKWYMSRNGHVKHYYKCFPSKKHDPDDPDEEKPKRLARVLKRTL